MVVHLLLFKSSMAAPDFLYSGLLTKRLAKGLGKPFSRFQVKKFGDILQVTLPPTKDLHAVKAKKVSILSQRRLFDFQVDGHGAVWRTGRSRREWDVNFRFRRRLSTFSRRSRRETASACQRCSNRTRNRRSRRRELERKSGRVS